MFEKLKDVSAGMSDRVKLTKESINKTRETSSKAIAKGREKSQKAIDKHWPAIEKVVVDGLVGITEEKLRDEDFLRSSFEKIYELLPTAARLVIGREKFVGYCIRHRDPILRRLESSKPVSEVQNRLEQSSESGVRNELFPPAANASGR